MTRVLKLLCLSALILFIGRPIFAQQSISFTNESFFSHNGVIRGAINHRPIASACVVGPKKDVVTCWHVIEAARVHYHETNLLFVGGDQVRPLKLKAAFPGYDLAIFSATPEIHGAPFYPGDFNKVKEGDTVLYVGYDARQSSTNEATQTTSAVSLATVTKKGQMMNDNVRVDAIGFVGDIAGGYSGGAVYNTNMEIIAVISLSSTQKANIAFSIEPIVKLLKVKTNSKASP